MKIVQALSDDIFILQKLGIETYKQHFANLWTTEGIDQFLYRDFSIEALKTSLADDLQKWFILYDQQAIPQGFAKLNLHKYNQYLKQFGTEIQKIYLLDTAIKENFGRPLFLYLLNYIKENQYKYVYLEVLSNNIRAQKFYKKFNFKVQLQIPYKTDLCDIGMTIMTLRI